MHFEKATNGDTVNKEKPFICQWKDCKRSEGFRQRYQLQAHVRSHTGYKPFACNFVKCTSTFTRRENLECHKTQHSQEKKFKCNFKGYCIQARRDITCNRVFGHHSDLIKHRPRHNTERPFPCKFDGCDKTYIDYGSRCKHMEKKHPKPIKYCIVFCRERQTFENYKIRNITYQNPLKRKESEQYTL